MCYVYQDPVELRLQCDLDQNIKSQDKGNLL